MTQAPKIPRQVSNHTVFVGRVAIFTPSLPPKKHHIHPFPQQKFHSRPLSRNLGSQQKQPSSQASHGYERFGARDEFFFGSPLGRKWQRGFSTKRSPGEVASTGSEEDEEGVMKLQRGITKSSKKGGITGRVGIFLAEEKSWVGF